MLVKTKLTWGDSVEYIDRLGPHEVFVFGSNVSGKHRAGAARMAWKRFGAVWGQGHGHHGQSYAIDTMSGPVQLRREVEAFCAYAQARSELSFILTEVGCGIARYRPEDVAPLFAAAPANVRMPERFQAVLSR